MNATRARAARRDRHERQTGNAHRPPGRRETSPLDPLSAEMIRALFGQRECTPGTAHLVRRLAPLDDRVKPRWHIDDCGWQNRSRGVHYRAPAGSYTDVRVWNGREHWLRYAVPIAMTLHAHVLQAAHVSRATFTRWAEAESLYANPRTGRRCVVRPITVSKVAAIGKSTVDRCRMVANRIGLRVVVFPGRMLKVGEKWPAWNRGSKQRGMSAETACTMNADVDNLVRKSRIEAPTRGRAPLEKKLPSRGLTYRAASGESTETASPPRPIRRRKRRDQRALSVARDLQAQLAWLRGSKLCEIIPVVHKCATDPLMPWTAYDVVLHMDSVNRRLGYTSPAQDYIRTSAASLLAWYLRDVDPQAGHPRLGAFLRGTATEQRPPWCGTCDTEATRHIRVPDGMARCPRCHPLAGEPPW